MTPLEALMAWARDHARHAKAIGTDAEQMVAEALLGGMLLGLNHGGYAQAIINDMQLDDDIYEALDESVARNPIEGYLVP